MVGGRAGSGGGAWAGGRAGGAVPSSGCAAQARHAPSAASCHGCSVSHRPALPAPRRPAEASLLQGLRHPNIVGFYGLALTRSKGVVLMELCEGARLGLWARVKACLVAGLREGLHPRAAWCQRAIPPIAHLHTCAPHHPPRAGRDLYSALEVRAAGTGERLFSWRLRGWRVALEVARALNYLHARGVVHCVRGRAWEPLPAPRRAAAGGGMRVWVIPLPAGPAWHPLPTRPTLCGPLIKKTHSKRSMRIQTLIHSDSLCRTSSPPTSC